MKLRNYLEQHDNITEEIDFIVNNISFEITEELAGELAKHINLLAGKLNIHLSMEDKYLYPSLTIKEKEIANFSIADYVNEMGGLANEFTDFKGNYNTRQKLIANKNSFKTDAKLIMNKILTRIKKEEDTIYKLID
jgi:hemerythrin-like domain-containing protein